MADHNTPQAVAERIKEWIGSYGGENSATLLLYEAMNALKATTTAAALEVPSVIVHLDRTLGIYGEAFDAPGPRRAYTYQHQPGNVAAYRLGTAHASAAAAPAGDGIDRGLLLLKELQAAGFGVFQIDPSDAAPQSSGNPGPLAAVKPSDTARLDWLEAHFVEVVGVYLSGESIVTVSVDCEEDCIADGVKNRIRAALDAAIAASKGNGNG